jgi:prepilin-type N-terminal cleavage/methylation domain-containing protein/prepilin-type processing-associated H-X9-DG protein
MPLLKSELEKMKTRRTKKQARGMTLIEVLVVIFVIAVIAAMFLPALAAAKRKHARIGCVNKLKEIGLSFKIWEGDNDDKYPMQFAITNADTMKSIASGNAYVFWQTMSNELATPRILFCPDDTEHTEPTNNFSTGFSDANISYFFNLDGNGTDPQMILIGDDNLLVNGTRVQPGILNLSANNSVAWTKERHNGAGNIGLADGSVQQVTSDGFKSALITTNRLVIP